MIEVLEVIRRTERFFAEAGIEKPRLDAELLLAEVLGCKRLELYLQFERPLDDAQLARLRPMVKRRANREPLQHIVGHVDFGGVRLNVDRRALVPRHETEELVDVLVERGKAAPPAAILDLGTGSGALALALAHAFPQARVTGVDASADALALARANAAALGFTAPRVSFVEGSWFERVAGCFDWIVSNPPYLTEAEWLAAEPEVRLHDPRMALVAAADGIADLLEILEGARGRLNPGGLLALETGVGHHAALAARAAALGYAGHESLKDFDGRDRFFIARV